MHRLIGAPKNQTQVLAKRFFPKAKQKQKTPQRWRSSVNRRQNFLREYRNRSRPGASHTMRFYHVPVPVVVCACFADCVLFLFGCSAPAGVLSSTSSFVWRVFHQRLIHSIACGSVWVWWNAVQELASARQSQDIFSKHLVSLSTQWSQFRKTTNALKVWKRTSRAFRNPQRWICLSGKQGTCWSGTKGPFSSHGLRYK